MNIDPELNWILTPADVLPPVETSPQEIPFGRLTPRNFERLCLRLAEKDADVEHCQGYGRAGQEQHGIDLYVKVRGSERYVTWQCKRHKLFGSSNVTEAITKFLGGAWAAKSRSFVLAVTVDFEDAQLADTLESERKRLNERGIEFTPLGIKNLATRLRPHADIVDEFFGRAYAEAFCDTASFERLRHRPLSPPEVVKLRALLHRYYAEHFEATDRGLPQAARSAESFAPLPLSERYVLQDLIVTKASTTVFDASRQQSTPDSESVGQPVEKVPERQRIQTVPVEIRIPSLQWVGDCNLAVVLGDPGIGKTAFLRYLILDLLSENPRHSVPAVKWGRHLPVWIPFALWAQMVSLQNGNCALSDVLHRWLKEMDAPPDLHDLITRSLEDDRLLLFVDGLDEWNDEDAAKIAVSLLEVFVGTRGVPAVVSSRPHGFVRLGGLSSRWRVASLAPLSTQQQRELTCRWLTHWNRPPSQGQSNERPNVMKQQIDALFHEVAKDSSLEKLAGIPLLLSSLLALFLAENELPRTRFKAYEKMVELLLRVQPARRKTAALVGSERPRLRPDNLERAIAFLAFEIHRSPSAVVISSAEACKVLSRYLQDTFGKQPSEAREIAEDILPIGSDATGLLVEKAPQAVGIIHRAFQEFLAGCHLTSLSPTDARSILELHWANPQWHHVVLAYCYLMRAHSEVDALVHLIQDANCPENAKPARSVLLAEIAFHDLNCSVTVARSIINETFNSIEFETWPTVRAQLLDHVLDGIHSDSVANESRAKISEWYPSRSSWRYALIESIGDWPTDDVLLNFVLRAIHDEELQNQRAAALIVSRKWENNQAVMHKLTGILNKPHDPNVTAATLFALYRGWPRMEKLLELLQQASKSLSPSIQIIGICGKVALGKAGDTEKEMLLRTDTFTHERCWRDELIEALIQGWPHDAVVKKRCLESLHRQSYERGMLDWEIAGRVLFRGFRGDKEVAQALAEVFETDKYPQHRFGGAWDDLASGFGGNPILSSAVDDWMTQEKAMIYETAHAALVSRSVDAKHRLLGSDPYHEPWPHWLLWALVQGWGANDENVKTFAFKLLSDPCTASKVALFLPDFVTDKAQCRSRLLDLLRVQKPERLDFIFRAARRIGINHEDEEFVEAALSHDYEARFYHDDPNPAGLFMTVGSHPRVRALALKEVRRRGGEFNALALTYRDDYEIRSALMRMLAPLPRPFRLQIVRRLASTSHDDEFTKEQVENYDLETDAEIKSAASITYYGGILARGFNTDVTISRLQADLNVVGHDYEARRAAAFAGLLALDRVDVAAGELKKQKSKSVGLRLNDFQQQNLVLIKCIGSHWESVQRAFNGQFLDFIQDERGVVLDSLAATRQDLPEVRQLIETSVQQWKSPPALRPAILRAFAEMHPKSDVLRDLCKHAVQSSYYSDWHHANEAIVAAEILGEYFSEDTELGCWLLELVSSGRPSSAALVALCRGWFNKPELREVSDRLLNEKRYILVPAKFDLLVATVEAKELGDRLKNVLDQLDDNIWHFLSHCSDSVLARMHRDADFVDVVFNRLDCDATPSEKATLPRLLARSPNAPKILHNWCEAELKRQRDLPGLPQLGLDLLAGGIRPVFHSLLDVAAFYSP